MRDVVVIGGGLTGLAAAYELERHDVRYTLIEVKPQLGGSIAVGNVAGFTFDAGPMVHTLSNSATFSQTLTQLVLADATATVADHEITFANGTHTLIEAFAQHITAPVIYRMAVSTLGRFGRSHYSICMENGMVLDARALIIASPARHSERMLHTLIPEAAHRLRDYRYQHVAYISVGYNSVDGPFPKTVEAGYPVVSLTELCDLPRMPAGTTLLQVGLRYEPEHGLPDDPVGELAALLDWPLNPLADYIGVWPDGETIMWKDEHHADRLRAVQALLPDSVALCGSDYIPTGQMPRLDERIAQGTQAARQVIATL